MFGVGTVDSHFHAGHGLAAGALAEVVPVLVGDDGGAFGGTVAHGEGEADALQEVLHFAVAGADIHLHIHQSGAGFDIVDKMVGEAIECHILFEYYLSFSGSFEAERHIALGIEHGISAEIGAT